MSSNQQWFEESSGIPEELYVYNVDLLHYGPIFKNKNIGLAKYITISRLF